MNTMSFPSVRPGSLILILGLGETGVAAALWCARNGARLRILDTREKPAGLATLQAATGSSPIEYRLGDGVLAEEALDGVDSVIISPGLSPLAEPVKSFVGSAARRQVEVIGEIELFARALADMSGQGYNPYVLAITGTNGKTTVTAMTRQLVQASGLSARAAGNISPAALAALMESLDADDLPAVWVLELSSFQLEATRSLAPDAAVVLNVTQDHLDWHGSMQAYAAAKAKLLRTAKIAVINRDDPLVTAMVPDARSTAVCSFGRGVSDLVGDFGIEDSHGVRWLTAVEATDFGVPAAKPKRNKPVAAAHRTVGRRVRLMPSDALRVRGSHNALNALAALALAHSLGLAWGELLRALRDYGGEPHRTEFVQTIAGVDFVNDSKGTNVGATVAALEGMDQTAVLIAGGLGKGQDFSPLAKPVKAHARAVVLIGQDADRIAQALSVTAVPLEFAATLEQAVARGFSLAREGDVVLLSPACASMDMFSNYRHRGAAFVEEVRALALEKGEVA